MRWCSCARAGMNRAAVLSHGMARMCVPYDMRLDATNGSELFCVALNSEMFPEADLPMTSVPGRETILIGSVVAGALSGDSPFGLVGYVEARADGSVRAISARELAWDIRQGWPEATQTPWAGELAEHSCATLHVVLTQKLPRSRSFGSAGAPMRPSALLWPTQGLRNDGYVQHLGPRARLQRTAGLRSGQPS
jgi:hypothetical protein